MNKIFFLFLALLLVACSPQVTVTSTATIPLPTETPIPTPTLHPDFITLQNTVAQTERFTLLSYEDGLLLDGERIPGLEVDRNGVITIEVDGERVEVDPTKAVFDDEHGLSFEGYELNEETGEWEVAISETVLQAKADFEKYGYEFSDTYEIIDDQGWVKITDPETGRDIYVDGDFDLRFLVENTDDSSPTNYQPKSEASVGVPNRPPDAATQGYFVPLFAEMREVFDLEYGYDPFTNDKSSFSTLMIDPDKLSYGIVVVVNRDSPSEQYFVYKTSDGIIKIIPLKSGSREQTMMFWVTDN